MYPYTKISGAGPHTFMCRSCKGKMDIEVDTLKGSLWALPN